MFKVGDILKVKELKKGEKFKVSDILKVKEDCREFVNEHLHLYRVIEIKENQYSGGVIVCYIIRSINNRKIIFEIYHNFVNSNFEEVTNFCTMFPDLCLGKKCCFRHDKRWIKLRNSNSKWSELKSKLKADLLLYRCVKKQALKCDSFVRHIPGLLGVIMFLGVNTPVGFYFYWRAQKTGIMQ